MQSKHDLLPPRNRQLGYIEFAQVLWVFGLFDSFIFFMQHKKVFDNPTETTFGLKFCALNNIQIVS